MTRNDRHPFLTKSVPWHFPLEKTHSGIPLSNATFGALIWGEKEDLRITLNRADYWDHRGGVSWGPEATWDNLKKWLEAGDEENIRRVFEGEALGEAEDPPRPTRLPMGRIDLRFPRGKSLNLGMLDLTTSICETSLADGGSFQAVMVRHDPILAIELSFDTVEVTSVPPNTPEVMDYFRRYGYPPVRVFDSEIDEGDGIERGGWVQEVPGEPVMCVAWQLARREGRAELLITSVYEETPETAMRAAFQTLSDHDEAGIQQLFDRTAMWWSGYWSRVAAVSLPDPERELLYYLGMYKLAGLSVPGSPAATLQGPWVEEYCMPPWSSDYHFNINVQECYWPAFAGNMISSLQPLWELIESWMPQLQQNAKSFMGIDDGLQLPHAVDDRCTCMGGFWTGSVDHGSTAWTGQLMWQQYRYTMDQDFLQETVYPFLKGTMRVYEAMLDKTDDGYRLPVSVSPEYNGAEMTAWGANSSFQLANIHFLCKSLIEASELLDVDATDRERWLDIHTRLPLTATDPSGNDIWLWEGQPLAESHRHHSHLAGLYPFDILDYHDNPAHRQLLDTTMNTWINRGMGLWTGWCMPWAAILHARTGNGEMADILLGIYRRTFMGPGYASTHDARFKGFTLMAGRPEIMQIEASMAASAAVLELLVQCSQGIIRLFPAVPNWWRDISFDGIRTEGAFLVSGRITDNELEVVQIISEAGALLKMVNPFAQQGCVATSSTGAALEFTGEMIEYATTPGEEIVLVPT